MLLNTMPLSVRHSAILGRSDIYEIILSTGHNDISTGNSWTPDRNLIADMLDPKEEATGLTFHDIAVVRVKREKLIAGRRLDFVHNRIALGEACLVVAVWGHGGNGDFTKVGLSILVPPRIKEGKPDIVTLPERRSS
jgi:hypothetical protein